MGSYGIGPGRIMAAALEQGGDDGSVLWPRSSYEIEVVSLDAGNAEIAETAAKLAAELDAAGRGVLLDDREQRPGEKFADADLFQAADSGRRRPETLEDGAVDARDRAAGEGAHCEFWSSQNGYSLADGSQAEVQRGALRRDDRAPDGRERA